MKHEFILWLKGKIIDENNTTFSDLCSSNKITINMVLNTINKMQSVGLYKVLAYPREIIHFITEFNAAFPGTSLELFEYRNI